MNVYTFKATEVVMGPKKSQDTQTLRAEYEHASYYKIVQGHTMVERLLPRPSSRYSWWCTSVQPKLTLANLSYSRSRLMPNGAANAPKACESMNRYFTVKRITENEHTRMITRTVNTEYSHPNVTRLLKMAPISREPEITHGRPS